MSKDGSKEGGPEAGFTQRGTIDPQKGELYIMSGLVREKMTSQEAVKSTYVCLRLCGRVCVCMRERQCVCVCVCLCA
jgi:hypothetical protein